MQQDEMTVTSDWQSIAKTTQESVNKKIPKEWRLPEGYVPSAQKDVSEVPNTCGILSPTELEITESLDACYILEKIHSKIWTAEEVMVAFCKRAAISHQLVNCLMEICFDEAIDKARAMDAHFEKTGKLTGPLHGLPISLKDHINVAGLRSTMGYCCLAENRPQQDALIVEDLKAAGAIVFVKTTMPVTAMVIETVSNLFGRTLNGFNRSLSSGGSSGGEGALIGLRGSPVGLGTDVGGSIRVPAAFNGIYGIRPSSRRLSCMGLAANVRGALAIPSVIGPMALSIRDLELICKVVTDAKPWLRDPNLIMMEWKPRPKIGRKLRVGVLDFDGVVMPHPPIRRAIKTVAELLRCAGHEVIPFEPYECQRAWDIAYPALYYATGGKEFQALLAKSGEPWPVSAGKLSASPIVRDRNLTVKELYNATATRDDYKLEYMQYWNATASKTKSGEPIDVLLCPISPSASFPHDFLPWWGYASQYNLLDVPGVIIPVDKVDKAIDLKDDSYSPVGPRDEENYKMYDPELWHGMPVSLQIVGRNYDDENILACSAIIDQIVKDKSI